MNVRQTQTALTIVVLTIANAVMVTSETVKTVSEVCIFCQMTRYDPTVESLRTLNLSQRYLFMLCLEEGICGNEAKTCHSLAQCITKDETEQCECNVGYIGDGLFCQGKNKKSSIKSEARIRFLLSRTVSKNDRLHRWDNVQ